MSLLTLLYKLCVKRTQLIFKQLNSDIYWDSSVSPFISHSPFIGLDFILKQYFTEYHQNLVQFTGILCPIYEPVVQSNLPLGTSKLF